MKKISIALIIAICLASVIAFSACANHYEYKPLDATVRYLTNVAGEKITLSSGREVISENVVYHTQSVKTGDILTPPEKNPVKVGYDFVGWATDKEGTTLFDFTKPVTGSLNLYAKWTHSVDSETTLDYVEPTLSFAETIDDSSAFSLVGVCNQPLGVGMEKIVEGTPFSLIGVCNMPVNESNVNLTGAGIAHLTKNATDIKAFLGYTRASSTVIQSAVYENGQVKVTYKAGSDPQTTVTISVTDVTESLGNLDAVNLTTAGINRLSASASDVKECLNYTRASSTTINSAVYQAGKVNVTYTSGGVQTTVSALVNDITTMLTFVNTTPSTSIDESTFETKAKQYESTDFASYKVIMAGSSSMENWSESSYDMLPVTTKNVGIGGSATEHWNSGLADRLIIPYSPRAVVFYLGINDIINYGKTGEETANGLKTLFAHIHDCLPDTAIYFILINHVPGYYTQNKDNIDDANAKMIAFAEENEYVNIIDAGTVLEKKSGVYSEAYFMKDGLHMSLAGYQLWGAVVKNTFIEREKEIYHG